jgi:hypothetical protein
VRYDATRYDGPSLTAVIAISHSGKRRVICFPCVERAVVLGRLRWYRVFVSGSGPRGGGQEERVYGSTSDGGRVVGRARCGLRRGISIEFPGIILGALGYYLGLTSQDRASRILGIVAVVLNVISIVISGLTAPPQ